jgi:hypothetical protein
MSRISFEPLPQVDIMARKWDERKAARAEAKLQANIQAKLAIGAVGDKYEQEADQVAAQVVQKINVPENIQRHEEEGIQAKSLEFVQRVEEEDEELQMKPLSESIQRVEEEDEELQMRPILQRRGLAGGGDASEELESSIQQARGGGQSLDPDLQVKMGQAMGADFSGVKVHTDATADMLNRSINARAFTTGSDIFFRQGEYNPNSTEGKRLIVHESTHTIQQGAIPALQAKPNVSQKQQGFNGQKTTLFYPDEIQIKPQLLQRETLLQLAPWENVPAKFRTKNDDAEPSEYNVTSKTYQRYAPINLLEKREAMNQVYHAGERSFVYISPSDSRKLMNSLRSPVEASLIGSDKVSFIEKPKTDQKILTVSQELFRADIKPQNGYWVFDMDCDADGVVNNRHPGHPVMDLNKPLPTLDNPDILKKKLNSLINSPGISKAKPNPPINNPGISKGKPNPPINKPGVSNPIALDPKSFTSVFNFLSDKSDRMPFTGDALKSKLTFGAKFKSLIGKTSTFNQIINKLDEYHATATSDLNSADKLLPNLLKLSEEWKVKHLKAAETDTDLESKLHTLNTMEAMICEYLHKKNSQNNPQ